MNVFWVLVLFSAISLCSSKVKALENDDYDTEIEYQRRYVPVDEKESGFQMPHPFTLIVGAVVGFVAAPVALPLIGFGAAGVTAGSLAAGVQSIIGNVAAGSGFAAMQSAGAVGAGLTTKSALAAGGAAIAATIEDKE